MARTNFILLPVALLAACAPSPLYVAPRPGTVGEVPRDGRGEPVWSAMRQPPPAPPVTPMPVDPVTTPK